MCQFKFGDWVAFDPGYKKVEVGRVTEDLGDVARVCYSLGCTASTTSKSMLRPATQKEIDEAGPVTEDGLPMIGYHRFDKYCPDYREDVCYMCKARKNDGTF